MIGRWRAVIIFLSTLFSCGSAYALVLSGANTNIDLIVVISGGGAVVSSNSDAKFTAIGENNIYLTLLTTSSHDLETGQGRLLGQFLAPPLPGPILISDLRAFTEPMGSIIPESIWQRDNDPYFTWHVDAEPASYLRGFSIALDKMPDTTVDTGAASYQFAENGIPSGKHVFYVLPITIGENPADTNTAIKFELWIDKDPPYVNQLSPASGQIISSLATPVSCAVADADSGVDVAMTTLSLNGGTLTTTYDEGKKILKSEEGAGLSEGRNRVLVKAYDKTGNYVTKGWDFIVDTQPPRGTISINGGQTVTHSAYVEIEVNADDAVSDVQSIYLSNDGVFDSEMGHPILYRKVITGWLLGQPDVDGAKTVYAKFRDSAGNLSEAAKATIVLKRLTPETRIISGPASITEKQEAEFKYEASKAGCSFSYKLDTLEWSPWSTSDETRFAGLAAGNHYFYAKAGYDLNGDGKITIDEEDATPAQWVWTVQPTGAIEKPKKRILFWRR
jgi:hypothetical protein